MVNINDILQTLGEYSRKGLIYLLIFVFFTINFIALSISIQCNRDKPLMFRIASGMFAFMFGVLYIIFNYFVYRIKITSDTCEIRGDNIFK